MSRPLTALEVDTLRRLFTGATSKETAYALGIRDKTLKERLTRIYAKLNVTNRWAAFAAAGLMDSLEVQEARIAAFRAEARAYFQGLADSLAP